MWSFEGNLGVEWVWDCRCGRAKAVTAITKHPVQYRNCWPALGPLYLLSRGLEKF